MKRILSFFIAIVMIISLMPAVTVSAAGYSGTCGKNLTWVYDPYTATLTVSGTGYMNNYGVYALEPWNSYRLQVEKVVIEEGVMSIGDNAFLVYPKLTEVSLPGTLVKIGNDAFGTCEALTEVTLPASLKECYSGFSSCTGLTTVNCEEGLTCIGGFYCCSSLKTVNLPDSLERIDEVAFAGCTSLEEITLPDGVTVIKSRAFESCTSLKTIRIPASVTTIGEENQFENAQAFENCTALDGIWVDENNPNYCSDSRGVLYYKDMTKLLSVPGQLSGSYVIPEGVTSVENYSFQNCDLLTEIVFPGTLETIPAYIGGCDQLQRVVISEGTKNINTEAFLNCTALEEVVLPEGLVKIGTSAFQGCASLRTISLPGTLTELGTRAFSGCSSLESINTPGSLNTLKEYIFEDCAALKTVTLSEGLTTIEYGAFFGCAALQEITLPDSLRTIESNAFTGCGLTGVTLPVNLNFLESNPFGGCAQLKEFRVAEGNTRYTAVDGVLFTKDQKQLIAVPRTISGSYEIPEGVTTVQTSALYGCKNLTEVTLPSTLTHIYNGAFRNCSGLTAVNFPSNLTYIGDNAFCNCDGLKEIALPEGLKTLKKSAFEHCDALVRVSIPGSVSEVGFEAFRDCVSLKTVTIGEGTRTISDYAFLGCTALTEITLPNSLWTVKSNAFEACTSLAEITIPDGIMTMGAYAFWNCTSLKTVYLPDSFLKNGFSSSAFTGCTGLTDVHFSSNEVRWNELIPAASSEELQNAAIHFTYDARCADDAHHVYTKEAKKVTCTEDGWTEASHCGLCGTVFAESTILTATGHDWTETGRAPSYEDPNVTIITYTCTNCKESKLETLAHEHQYAPAYMLPTCTQQGCTYFFCSCGDSYYGDYVDPLGHDWDEGKVTKEPTEEAAGMRLYTCTRENCGETRRETIPVLEHTHSYKDGVCTGCGAKDPDWVKPEEVSRLAGSNRWDTAIKVADQMKENLGLDKFGAIIIASGDNFADALAGSYLSAVKSAPILLCWNGGGRFEYLNQNILDYIDANLAEDGTVYILGGKGAVPMSFDEKLGSRVNRLNGSNRFETNLMILKEAGVKAGEEILVCTSTNFADSLSASATGKPILLVYNEGGKLFDNQKAYLSSLSGNTFTILGGEGAVSEKMAGLIGAYGTTTRLAGASRFETSVLVAEKYFENPDSAVLAYAWNYPDGLCGGGLAYSMNAPLILTMTKYETRGAKDYIQGQGIGNAVVLGGTGLISDDCVKNIFGKTPTTIE